MHKKQHSKLRKQHALMMQVYPSVKPVADSWVEKNPGWGCRIFIEEYPPKLVVQMAFCPGGNVEFLHLDKHFGWIQPDLKKEDTDSSNKFIESLKLRFNMKLPNNPVCKNGVVEYRLQIKEAE